MSVSLEIRDPLVGTRVDGRYQVLAVLGRGGMGVVYDAVHEQLGRPVALKVLGPGVAGDPVAVQRFLREARTASQLTHGNIVDVSDLGTLPDGRPYLVMPKLQGVDLCTLLHEQGVQTPRRTCELLRGAAAALDLIHAKGLVHRDVKPENLMHVVHDDGSEAVLLLDFGIVGLISPDSARLTAEGVVFGTPAYLAPEVIHGDTPGPRADIYSLATVACELITGRVPFSSPNVMQLLQLKLNVDAPPLSVLAGMEIPAPIEAVLKQSLAREPKLRHASAGTFVAALERAVRASMAAQPVRPERLDTGARQRLQSGTGALELSLLDSARPRAAVGAAALAHNVTDPADAPAGVARRGKSPPGAAVTEHAPNTSSMSLADADLLPVTGTTQVVRRPGKKLAAAAGALLLLGAAGWLATRRSASSPAPPAEHVVAPAPSAAAKQPDPAPLPSAAAPEPPQPGPSQPAASAVRTASSTPGAAVRRQDGEAQRTAARPKSPPSASVNAEPRAVPVAPSGEPAPRSAPAQPSAAQLIAGAQAELVQGHLIAAADLYERATRIDPSSAAAFRGLGLASERLGRKNDAVRALRRAIALSPDDPKNALLEARVRKLEGQ